MCLRRPLVVWEYKASLKAAPPACYLCQQHLTLEDPQVNLCIKICILWPLHDQLICINLNLNFDKSVFEVVCQSGYDSSL